MFVIGSNYLSHIRYCVKRLALNVAHNGVSDTKQKKRLWDKVVFVWEPQPLPLLPAPSSQNSPSNARMCARSSRNLRGILIRVRRGGGLCGKARPRVWEWIMNKKPFGRKGDVGNDWKRKSRTERKTFSMQGLAKKILASHLIPAGLREL